MTTVQRRHVRQSLIASGFERTNFTQDAHGDGTYQEIWTHPDSTTVIIGWGRRIEES